MLYRTQIHLLMKKLRMIPQNSRTKDLEELCMSILYMLKSSHVSFELHRMTIENLWRENHSVWSDMHSMAKAVEKVEEDLDKLIKDGKLDKKHKLVLDCKTRRLLGKASKLTYEQAYGMEAGDEHIRSEHEPEDGGEQPVRQACSEDDSGDGPDAVDGPPAA